MIYCSVRWPLQRATDERERDYHYCNREQHHISRCVCACGALCGCVIRLPGPILGIVTRRETPDMQTWTDVHQERADRGLAPRHPEER